MSVKAAVRIKAIVDDLLTTRIADLTDQTATERRLGELRAAIDDVQSFARSLEGLLGRFDGPRIGSRRAAGRPGKRPGRKPGRRPGRKPGRKPGRRPGRKPGPKPGLRLGRPPGRSGRRRRGGPGEFAATPFILGAVREAGKGGIRPREIVAKVVAAAPGHHVRPSALVSTILSRLKGRGEVGRRADKWFART